ncbi:MAG: MoaD/ThiS family protein [Planctomycetota bacterium]
MVVTVKLFGPFATELQRSEVQVQLAGPQPTVADLRGRLAAAEPALAPLLGVSRFAVNHEFAREHRALAASDEIALIGLVSGG